MLTHINHEGQVHMVDVSPKEQSLRTARAQGFIALKAQTLELVRENKIKKGSVLTTASLAGIQAAKQCSQLIPCATTSPCRRQTFPLRGIPTAWKPRLLSAV